MDANGTRQSSAQSEGASQLPMPAVASVPLRVKPESRLCTFDEGGAAGADQFRLLLGRLMEVQARTALKRLLITSAVNGEGKTNVATNLALLAARESRQKVLLVDADIRQPGVHGVFGLENGQGVVDLLRSGREPWKAIRKAEGLNLYVLTAGAAHDEPLTTARILTLKAMLDQVAAAFELVVIDSPALEVAEAPMLAQLADAVLLVLRAFKTGRDLVLKAKDVLQGNTLLGTVITRLDP